jgi:hypothetical protein
LNAVAPRAPILLEMELLLRKFLVLDLWYDRVSLSVPVLITFETLCEYSLRFVGTSCNATTCYAIIMSFYVMSVC